MKNLKKIIIPLFIITLFVLSCTEDVWKDHYENEPPVSGENILTYLQGNPEYSKLANLVVAAKLDSILTSATNVTFFAVKNENIPDGIESDLEGLKTRLLLHMTHGKYYDHQINDGQRIKTLHGKYLEVSQTSGNKINELSYDAKNIHVGNGVIHELEQIIAPQPNVYEFLYALGDEYSTIKEYLLDMDVKTFDRENSVPVGVNDEGNTVYDTIWVMKNKLLSGVNDARKEDYLFTAFYPTNDVVEEAIGKVRNDYAAAGGELSEKLDAELYEWCVTSLFRKGVLENPADTMIKTTNGGDFWISPGKQEVLPEMSKASNGVVYTVSHLHVPKLKYMNKFVFEPRFYWKFDKATRDTCMVLEEGTNVYFMQRGGGYEPAWGYGWYGLWGVENRDKPNKASHFKVKFPYSTTVTEDDELKVVSLIPGEYEIKGQSGITNFGIWKRPSEVQLYVNDDPLSTVWNQWEYESNQKSVYLDTYTIPDEAGTNPISISLKVMDRSPKYTGSGGKARNRAFIKRLEFIPTKNNY
ncbi:fasciclin domain-containing protein [Puteibacter caeruleilacunae]|nr:fasciclin domain-containing protein [Puteibacter caeruleilacunae]